MRNEREVAADCAGGFHRSPPVCDAETKRKRAPETQEEVMTETEVEIVFDTASSNLLPNITLETAMHEAMTARGPIAFDEEDIAFASAIQQTFTLEAIESSIRLYRCRRCQPGDADGGMAREDPRPNLCQPHPAGCDARSPAVDRLSFSGSWGSPEAQRPEGPYPALSCPSHLSRGRSPISSPNTAEKGFILGNYAAYFLYLFAKCMPLPAYFP